MTQACEDIARKAYGGRLPQGYQRTAVTLACGVKRCGECWEWLPLSTFPIDRQRHDGVRNQCKACVNAYHRAWHRRPENVGKNASYTRQSRDRDPDRDRENRLRARCKAYGITVTRYREMLAEQDGCCGMCDQPPAEGEILRLDHDHACCPDPCRSCGRCLRGLLCDPCNKALGFIEAYSTMADRYLGKNPIGKG